MLNNSTSRSIQLLPVIIYVTKQISCFHLRLFVRQFINQLSLLNNINSSLLYPIQLIIIFINLAVIIDIVTNFDPFCTFLKILRSNPQKLLLIKQFLLVIFCVEYLILIIFYHYFFSGSLR